MAIDTPAGLADTARPEQVIRFRPSVREPMALFWGVLFPLVLIVVFGVTGGYPEGKLGGQSLVDVYVPVMMVFVLTVVAAQVLPAILASYRDGSDCRTSM